MSSALRSLVVIALVVMAVVVDETSAGSSFGMMRAKQKQQAVNKRSFGADCGRNPLEMMALIEDEDADNESLSLDVLRELKSRNPGIFPFVSAMYGDYAECKIASRTRK